MSRVQEEAEPGSLRLRVTKRKFGRFLPPPLTVLLGAFGSPRLGSLVGIDDRGVGELFFL